LVEGVAGARPEGDTATSGGSHRLHPPRDRRRPRRSGLGLRRYHPGARGARGRLEVPGSDRGAPQERLDSTGRTEGGGAERTAGAAGGGTARRGTEAGEGEVDAEATRRPADER